MFDDSTKQGVAVPLPLPLRCGLEARSPDLDPTSQGGSSFTIAVGDETWQVRAFDRRRAFAIMRELSPLLIIGADRGNSFAFNDHTFAMWWRSSFQEDRGLCHELAERASSLGPRPNWEHALAASLRHAASALGLQLDERLLAAWGDIKMPSGYRLSRPRRVAARLELTPSVRRFTVEAELARPLPETRYTTAPKIQNQALLALRGLSNPRERQRFVKVMDPTNLEASSTALESALQALPEEIAEGETGSTLRVSVHDIEDLNSVHALVWSTAQLAAKLDEAR